MAITGAPEIRLTIRYPVHGSTDIPEGSYVNVEVLVVDTETGSSVDSADITSLYWGVWTGEMGSPLDNKNGQSDVGFVANPTELILGPYVNIVTGSSVDIGDTEEHVFACKIQYTDGSTYACHAEARLNVLKLHLGSDL